jgi:putative transposase
MENIDRRRIYDHRIKILVAKSKNPDLFSELNIPQSNAYRWARNGPGKIVTSDLFDVGVEDLIINLKESEIARKRAEALMMLQTVVAEAFGFSIEWKRLPSSAAKAEVLGNIERACESADLKDCLEAINMSPARHRNWKNRSVACDLEDQSSCPKLSPSKITTDEVAEMENFVTAKEFAHYPISALSTFAMKVEKLYCSSASWYRIIKKKGWKRPKKRIYPEKPRIGLRATGLNEYWHVDATLMRLQDGSKAYLQVISDNFSKFIVAWRVSHEINGLSTKNLVLSAISKAETLVEMSAPPTLIVDDGTENVNSDVYSLKKEGLIDIKIAQLEIKESNSAAEVIFRMAKHNYLFFQSLDNLASFERHCKFYLEEFSEVIPHSALKGGTPAEIYLSKWGVAQLEELQTAMKEARSRRRASNQSKSCISCVF